MALNSRQEQEAHRLKGVNLFDDPIDVQLGTFCLLANFIPATIYSFKKKRGVDAVPSGGMLQTTDCEEAVVGELVFCGEEQVFCGDEPLVSTVIGSGVIMCGDEPIVGLDDSEITCE